jgi:EAL domain-containing protein (putative c-di-GMP-specific phosphodiesterase class I)
MTLIPAEQLLGHTPSWAARTAHRGAQLPPVVAAVIIGALLALCWALVYVSGGTRLALPHLFYVPIVLATLPFRLRGSLLVGLAAAVLCGPLMPLDSTTGEMQQASAWLLRGGMFLGVGAVAALSQTLRTQAYEHQLSREVRTALADEASTTKVDESLVPLVAGVLKRRDFHPVFQPIYSLCDGKLLAVEALTRFDVMPYRTPDLWFAAAERAGVQADLEIAAIEAAIDASWELPPEIELSVNASPSTLGDERLLAAIRASSRRITVEITEHSVIDDYAGLLTKVHALRDLGAKIAVDDAGAGISSLRHIVQLGPDVIKLDISLTQGLAHSPLRRALAGSLIEFAERSGAQLLVEGVEELDDLEIWSALGAHSIQGYLLGRPANLPVAMRSEVVLAHRVGR